MPKSVSSEQRAPLDQHRRVPVSTYRLQFNRDVTFSEAARLIPYLARLGITDCYTSPYLKAAPGSPHGYDICDHNALNPELGTAQDYERFTAALAAHRMGQLADFVPNHMGISPRTNPWWWDVLENGPSSPYAGYFDINWNPVMPELKNKLLLPILEDQYGAVLERAELRLRFREGTFVLRYHETDLPINPRQSTKVLRYALEALEVRLGNDHPALLEYLSIMTALHNLPTYTERDPARIAERRREKAVAHERLRRLDADAPDVHQAIESAVQRFNGRSGLRASFDPLHELLEAQAYRLAYWRTAAHEINYRRFFDINTLAAIRMEDPEVFDASHQLILRLIREGKITGLRIDHADGLFDPARYFQQLQHTILEQHNVSAAARACAAETGPAWPPPSDRQTPSGKATEPFYIVAEKILSDEERLPQDWAIDGTTGYEFLNDLNGLFIDRDQADRMREIYRQFTGKTAPFALVTYVSKRLITMTSMASELNVLAYALHRIAEADRCSRDFTLESLREVLREVVACFPVYRTYVTASGSSPADQEAIDVAIVRARRRNPAMEQSIFDFLRSTLMPQDATAAPAGGHGARVDPDRLEFAMKFQQYTAPVQAKGIEDTACYRYHALLSLNDVGGTPERFGCAPETFHDRNRARHARNPCGMLATATHDTKRGEDARARLNILSEIPEQWQQCLAQWSALHERHRRRVDGDAAPDRNDEYLFYQALLGSWPAAGTIERDARQQLAARLRDYMLKAVKESKLHTSWINDNQAYDEAVARFVELTLTGPESDTFLASLLPFQQLLARLGMLNSLAQVVLKIASPGVADFYQGTELWDLSLVDPDNRRSVDYEQRQQLLDDLEPLMRAVSSQGSPERLRQIAQMLERWQDGRIKLFLIVAGLRLRRQHPALFLDGDYVALRANGTKGQHVVACARQHGDEVVLAVVPRLNARLTTSEHPLPIGKACWDDTEIPVPAEIGRRAYRNVLTGDVVQTTGRADQRSLPLAEVLSQCPVALLYGEADDGPGG